MNALQKLSSVKVIVPILTATILITASIHLFLSPEPASSQPNIKTIAVVPFFKGQKPETETTVMETELSQFHFIASGMAPGAETTLTRLLYKALIRKYEERVLPIEQVTHLMQQVLKQTEGPKTPLEIALSIGKALKADYVVIGNVWRFRERSGNAIASEHPSSVAFGVHLVSVSGGARIWKGVADKTQQPLSENLLKAKDFFEQGAHWLTAEELAKREMDTILKRLPVIRDNY